MIDQITAAYRDFAAQYLSVRAEWGTWVDLIAIFAITALLDIATRVVLRVLHDKVLATRNLWDDALYRSVNGPLQVLLWIGGITLAIRIGTAADQPWRDYVPAVRGVLIVLVFLWFAFRLIASIEKNALSRATLRYKHLDNTSADALAKLARAVVLVIGMLVLLQQLGVSPSSLLAFSGVGGIAIGFAARDVMARSLEQRGTSFDSLYVNVNGASGYFSRSLNAYGQAGKPCLRCGTPIERLTVGGRSSYFCPVCQVL